MEKKNKREDNTRSYSKATHLQYHRILIVHQAIVPGMLTGRYIPVARVQNFVCNQIQRVSNRQTKNNTKQKGRNGKKNEKINGRKEEHNRYLC